MYTITLQLHACCLRRPNSSVLPSSPLHECYRAWTWVVWRSDFRKMPGWTWVFNEGRLTHLQQQHHPWHREAKIHWSDWNQNDLESPSVGALISLPCHFDMQSSFARSTVEVIVGSFIFFRTSSSTLPPRVSYQERRSRRHSSRIFGMNKLFYQGRVTI